MSQPSSPSHGHAHGHSHGHAHGHDNFRLAFWLNLSFALIELVGGLLTNSLAIFADALHDLGDSLAIGFAWRMEKLARGGRTPRYSYGLRRFSLLAAVVNALVLIAGSLWVLSEAVPRLQEPQAVHAPGMLALAVLGIAVNGFAALRMRRESSHNARMIAWHLYEDVLGWLAVLIVAAILLWRPIPVLDPLLSLLIAAWVIVNVWRQLRATLRLFLQATPEGLSISDVETAVCADPAVASVHDLHLWSLDGERHVLTLHVQLRDGAAAADSDRIKSTLRAFADAHGIHHTTVEIEAGEATCSMPLTREPTDRDASCTH